MQENIRLYEVKNKDTIEFRYEEVIIGRAADTPPAETVYFDDYDIYEFIGWHHAYDVIMDSDELKPEMDTLFATYKTWILESMLGGAFL